MVSLSSIRPYMSVVRVSVNSMGGSSMVRNISGERWGMGILGTEAARSPARMKAMVAGKLICLAMRVMATTRIRML